VESRHSHAQIDIDHIGVALKLDRLLIAFCPIRNFFDGLINVVKAGFLLVFRHCYLRAFLPTILFTLRAASFRAFLSDLPRDRYLK